MGKKGLRGISGREGLRGVSGKEGSERENE